MKRADREPWGNIERRAQVAIVMLVALLFLIDAGIIYGGYLIDGWRGSTILASALLIQANRRALA